MKKPPLTFSILGECTTTKARASVVGLPHHHVNTPVFMPVGTQGSIKGILPEQLEALDCHIILANTYHLGTRPGADLLKKAGGLHKFMGWNRALLTDSGGFQMVSLLPLAEINEDGVKFRSPYNDSECMLTPEHSMEIQNAIGADIMMQLDDVVDVKIKGPRVEEAMHRTTRWLDRCLKAHQKPDSQVIFPIVQGGLTSDWRAESARQLLERNTYGIAIGGLSGGESKDEFWKIVHFTTSRLPRDKPRYLMGVGYAEDLVVCVALGVDMFDCVFPTRTARFGTALTDAGDMTLKNSTFAKDFKPISEDCNCSTCARYTRAYLHSVTEQETVGCHLLTVHNIAYQLNLMRRIRQSILDQKFPQFVQQFLNIRFPNNTYPKWIIDALEAVSIKLDIST